MQPGGPYGEADIEAVVDYERDVVGVGEEFGFTGYLVELRLRDRANISAREW
jgi:hypothetical protein